MLKYNSNVQNEMQWQDFNLLEILLENFAWRKVVLRIFDLKQLLRASCILWCYFTKWYSIILLNASLWCSFFRTENIYHAWKKDIYSKFTGTIAIILTCILRVDLKRDKNCQNVWICWIKCKLKMIIINQCLPHDI